MRKTDKKREKAIVATLNKACNILLDKDLGFKWLTHFINYDNYPESLSIVCIFDTNRDLTEANKNIVVATVCERLAHLDIKRRMVESSIRFDTEENCQQENNGNWSERLHSVRF